MRKRSAIILALVITLASFCAACSKTVRGIAHGVYAASEIAGLEIADAINAGDLSETDGKRLGAFTTEVGTSARVLELTAASWKVMTPAQKREAVLRFIRETAEAQDKLDGGGNPIFKSEKARARFAEFQKWVRRAETALRLIEEPLPAPEPSLTSAPTSAQ